MRGQCRVFTYEYAEKQMGLQGANLHCKKGTSIGSKKQGMKGKEWLTATYHPVKIPNHLIIVGVGENHVLCLKKGNNKQRRGGGMGGSYACG